MQSYSEIRFKNLAEANFFPELRKRVEAYFETNKITQYANSEMIIKTIVLLTTYYACYAVWLFVGWSPLLWCLIPLMGMAKAGIGLSIMHDANHGAYSDKKWVNTLLGLNLDLIGGNSFTWKVQHNVLHHTYTNVFEHDEDINTKAILRMSPHAPLRWYHKYQYIYAFLLYGLLTIAFLFKDFRQTITFYKETYHQRFGVTGWGTIVHLVTFKIIYLGLIIGLPLFWTKSFTGAQIAICFFSVHFITGMILSFIFQMAHVTMDAIQPLPDETGLVESAWAAHQLKTTCDFARSNKFLSWYCGGLNHQIEHHLFPQYCHVHYTALAPIVKKTAEEFGLPYYDYKTFGDALGSHFNMLKVLGYTKS